MFDLLDKNGSVGINGFLTFELDNVAYEISCEDRKPIIVVVTSFTEEGTDEVNVYFDKDEYKISYIRTLTNLGLTNPQKVHIIGVDAGEIRIISEKAIHDWAQYLIDQRLMQGVKK